MVRLEGYMNAIVSLTATALPNEKRYILLCGAGVSKDAGVPTGWEIMLNTANHIRMANADCNLHEDVETWFKNSEYKDWTYSELLSKVFPTTIAQQEYLSEHLENKEIGLSHTLIAQLAKKGIIKAIITTNFDKYIEKALDKENLSYQVISSNEDLITSEPLALCKKLRIYKPHGTIGVGAIRNTPADLQTFPDEFANELKKVISEHGLIILGYAGNEDDKALLDIIETSNFYGRQVYPTYWVNPSRPSGRMKNILENRSYINLEYNAAEFINHFFEIQERLNELAPDNYNIKTITDIEHAFVKSNIPLVPIYKEFLNELKNRVEKTRPDFNNFEFKDEAIIEQIAQTKNILLDFIRASKLAIDYKNKDLINLLYENFWSLSYFYSIPKNYRASFSPNYDFNGFQFLIMQMLISFVALLLKNNENGTLGTLLKYKNMTKQSVSNPEEPVNYTYFYKSLAFDSDRKRRLNINKISIVSDLIKEIFEDEKIKKYLAFEDFVQADYLLYLYSTIHEERWYPNSIIYIDEVPEFILNSYRKIYYDNLLTDLDLASEQFVEGIKKTDEKLSSNIYYFGPDFFNKIKYENFGKF